MYTKWPTPKGKHDILFQNARFKDNVGKREKKRRAHSVRLIYHPVCSTKESLIMNGTLYVHYSCE